MGFRTLVSGLLYLRTFDYLPTNFTLEFRDQLWDGTYPDGVFEEHPIDEMLRVNDSRFFRRNLESMIGTAEIHDHQPGKI